MKLLLMLFDVFVKNKGVRSDNNDLIPVVVVVLAPEVGKIVVVGIVEEFDITTERSTRNRKIRHLL